MLIKIQQLLLDQDRDQETDHTDAQDLAAETEGGETPGCPGCAAAMGSKLGRTRGEQTRHREHFWDLNPSHEY